MAHIQDLLKVPMVMHNRQWSVKSDYIKNEPFEWYVNCLLLRPMLMTEACY